MKIIKSDLDDVKRYPEGMQFPSDDIAVIAIMRERERALREAQHHKREAIEAAKVFYEQGQKVNDAVKRYNQCSRAIAKLEGKSYYDGVDEIKPTRFIPFLNGEDKLDDTIENGSGSDPQSGLAETFGETVELSGEDLEDILRGPTGLPDCGNTAGGPLERVLSRRHPNKGVSEKLPE